jgi:hypothetical protein
MFDDLETEEKKTEGDRTSSEDKRKSSWWIGRWAHVIAIPVFCALYFPFQERSWSLPVAIIAAYIVFMLCCTCGLAFKDADDLLGRPETERYMASLVVRQVFVLALVSLGAFLWIYLRGILPTWVTYEGRKGSLWDYCGLLLAYVMAVREASWMAARIKRRFRSSEDSKSA